MKRLAAAVVLVVGFAVPAVAQTETVIQEPDREIVRKITRYDDFGPETVSGRGFVSGDARITGEHKPIFESQVKVRVSFNTELVRSTDSL